LWFDRK